MALYRYDALDNIGKAVTGTVESGTPAEARAALRKGGLLTTRVEPAITLIAMSGANRGDTFSTPTIYRLSSKRFDDLVGFSRHLSLLLKSGVPLSQSLVIISEQLDSSQFKHVVADVAVRVKEGASLDQALATHPGYFPEMYVCIAKAGAASGNLAQLLNQLSQYYVRQKRLRDKVISALMYPALMSCIGAVVLTFLLAFVVPKITGVLLEQNRVLPWPTEVLLAVSNFIQGFWWVLLAATAFGVWLLSALLRTQGGRRFCDAMVLKIPIIGELLKKQAIARWADTMSNLISSGIPVAQALAVVRGALGNAVLAREVEKMEMAIIDGGDLSDALRDSANFPRSVGFIVGVGEESGDLPRVLKEIAESFNEEVEVISSRLADLLNPVLIVVLGTIIGFIVAAILLPITDFSQIQ